MVFRKRILVLFTFLALLASCGKYEYRNTEEFNLQPSVLKSGTEIDFIHSSGDMYLEGDKDYYFQFIVKPTRTNDTIRVLTKFPTDIDYSNKLGYASFFFTGGTENGLDVLAAAHADTDKVTYEINRPSLLPFVRISKEFKDIETANYPTTFGVFALKKEKNYNIQKDLDVLIKGE